MHREFKQGFIANDFSEYTKTIAAFANTDGGQIIFGVTDSPVGSWAQIAPSFR